MALKLSSQQMETSDFTFLFAKVFIDGNLFLINDGIDCSLWHSSEQYQESGKREVFQFPLVRNQ